MKKIPQRTCMGCNQKKDKKLLLRIVINKERVLSIDNTGKLEGRGAYVCNNLNCVEKVIKNKRLEKVLEVEIDNNFYKKIREVISSESK